MNVGLKEITPHRECWSRVVRTVPQPIQGQKSQGGISSITQPQYNQPNSPAAEFPYDQLYDPNMSAMTNITTNKSPVQYKTNKVQS